MNELDVVKLIKNYESFSIGTEGTIVAKYNDDYYCVELFNSNGETIGLIDVDKTYIKLIESMDNK